MTDRTKPNTGPIEIVVSTEDFDWLLGLLDKHPEPNDALLDEIMRSRPTLGKRLIEVAAEAEWMRDPWFRAALQGPLWFWGLEN